MQGWFHPQWAETSPIKHYFKKCALCLPTAWYHGGIFLNWESLLLTILACVKLTETNQDINATEFPSSMSRNG